MVAAGFSTFSSGLHEENARADRASVTNVILFTRFKSFISGFIRWIV